MARQTVRVLLLVIAISTLCFAFGCSGKAHQAPLPDYSNMTDEGGGTAEAE